MTAASTLLRSPHAARNGFQARSGHRAFQLEDAESSLAHAFWNAAAMYGNEDSIIDSDGSPLTYSELRSRALSIGGNLRKLVPDSRSPVALLLPTTSASVPVLLGALAGGFSYLALDPHWPLAQIEKFLRLSAAQVLVTPPGLARSFPGLPTVCWDNLHATVSDFGLEPPRPGETAAIFATSGSTGDPKLVALSHRAILFDIGRQTNDLYLGPDDRFDLTFSFAFSASLAPLFGALLNGGQLHALDLKERTINLVDWLEKRQISISTMTPSTLRAAAGSLPASARSCPKLRLLSVGGEAVLASDVATFRRVFHPSAVLQNAMAATETRTYAQLFIGAGDSVPGVLPIGWPVLGKEVVLLNEQGRPIEGPGEGEIAIRSRYLAAGYTNDPVQTGAKFQMQTDGFAVYKTGDECRRAPDGCLFFLGRKDLQVKVRGYRVELGAIESAISQYPGVRECAVVVRDGSLTAFLVSENGVVQGLARYLEEKLPRYMLPEQFSTLAALPLTSTGKIDRLKLSTIAISAASLIAEVLGTPELRVDASFLEHGGDSLKALRLLVQLEEQFGYSLPPDLLWSTIPVSKIASLAEGQDGSDRRAAIVPLRPDGPLPPFFLVHPMSGSVGLYRTLSSLLAGNRPVFGFQKLHHESAVFTIASLASDYVDQIFERRLFHPELVLGGFSVGGIIAFEMGRQIAARGFRPPAVVIIDMPSPNHPGLKARSSFEKLRDTSLNLPSWLRWDVLPSPKKLLLRRVAHRLRNDVAKRRAQMEGRTWTGPLIDPQLLCGTPHISDAHRQGILNLRRALDLYIAGRYQGAILLLKAKGQALSSRRMKDMGWGHLTSGPLAIHTVPGSHDSCLKSPHVAATAQVLKKFLDS